MKPKKENLKGKNPAYKIVLLALFFALAMVLSLAESILLPTLPMGIKLGLSNIIVMYCLFFIGEKEALTLAVLKAIFVLLVKSFYSALISLSGGLFSVLVMGWFIKSDNKKTSYLLISVFGALAHNIGQLAAVVVLMQQPRVAYLLPVLVISGCVVGCITGTTLKILLPHVKRITEQFKSS